MHAYRPDRWLDAISGVEMVVGVLWLGLAAISVSLLVLMRTRWGQAQPLRKCMVLSLLAHLLLIGYATQVRILAPSSPPSPEPFVKIALAEETYEPRDPTEAMPTVQKPWEAFADPPKPAPNPAEVARAETAEPRQPQRRTAVEPETLTPDPAPQPLALDNTPPPEPQDLPSPPNPAGPPPSKPAEPIRAPAAQRSDGPGLIVPAGPAPARRGEADPPAIEPERQTPEGIDASLVQQPRPMPTTEDAPVRENPGEALAALHDTLPSPSHGRPAQHQPAGEPEGASAGAAAALAAAAGSAGASSDPLPPTSPSGQERNATGDQRLVSLPHDSRTPGLRLPAPPAQIGGHAIPEIYQLRVAPDRSQIAGQMGATPETEEAVRAALRWLRANQESTGRWNAEAHGAGRELMVAGRDRLGAGRKADTGMTGLALLAFLAAGHTHKAGDYQATVEKGLRFLLSRQDGEGGLGGEAELYAYMYCHAMATFALSEAYGMTGDATLREHVRRAVARTLNAQNPTSGGWRYYPGDPGDTSQLGWQLMALKSAELAGIPMPDAARRGAIRFLESVRLGQHGGLASYRPGERATRPMTAEALACRQFLGLIPDQPLAREAGDYLLAELPGEGAKNFYYWYYGTLAMFQLQGSHWERWNAALRTTLVRSQRKSGPLAGSWDTDTVWGGYGGRVYTTAMGALCLEVYYRFLPLYVEVASAPLPRR